MFFSFGRPLSRPRFLRFCSFLLQMILSLLLCTVWLALGGHSPGNEPHRIPVVWIDTGSRTQHRVQPSPPPSVHVHTMSGTDYRQQHLRTCPGPQQSEQWYGQAALAASHVEGITAAYRAGAETALILEGGVLLDASHGDIERETRRLVDRAPRDWKILQLLPDGPQKKTVVSIRDPFVAWHPQSVSTGAYVVSREGMERLMRRFAAKRGPAFCLDVPREPFTTGGLVYSSADTYTATDSIFMRPGQNPDRPPPPPFHTGLKVLVCQVLGAGAADVHRIVQEAVQTFSPQVVTFTAKRWIIYAVQERGNGTVGHSAGSGQAELPEWITVEFRASASPGPSPWDLYHRISPAMSDYDQVLLMDGRVDLRGFPVGEFFQRHLTAFPTVPVLSGIPFYLPVDRLEGGDADWLATSAAGFWLQESRVDILAVPVDVLEPFLVLGHGWFLQKLFERVAGLAGGPMLPLSNVWCAAAESYAPRNVSCALFPLPAPIKSPEPAHRDTMPTDAYAHRRFMADLPEWMFAGDRFQMVFGGLDPEASVAPDAFNTRRTPPVRRAPRVSVMVLTYQRPEFLRLALGQVFAQDYPVHEVVVVDDSADPASGWAEGLDARVRYHHFKARMTVGEKRNYACGVATGDVMVHWDDDDSYAPGRIRTQVEPIAAGLADLSLLDMRHVLVLPRAQCYTFPEGLWHYGTLAYRLSVWGGVQGVRFANTSYGEDVVFAMRALGQCRPLRAIPSGEALYVRNQEGAEQRNTWKWDFPAFMKHLSLEPAAPPPWVRPEHLEAMGNAARAYLSRPWPGPPAEDPHFREAVAQEAFAIAHPMLPKMPSRCCEDSSQTDDCAPRDRTTQHRAMHALSAQSSYSCFSSFSCFSSGPTNVIVIPPGASATPLLSCESGMTAATSQFSGTTTAPLLDCNCVEYCGYQNTPGVSTQQTLEMQNFTSVAQTLELRGVKLLVTRSFELGPSAISLTLDANSEVEIASGVTLALAQTFAFLGEGTFRLKAGSSAVFTSAQITFQVTVEIQSLMVLAAGASVVSSGQTHLDAGGRMTLGPACTAELVTLTVETGSGIDADSATLQAETMTLSSSVLRLSGGARTTIGDLHVGLGSTVTASNSTMNLTASMNASGANITMDAGSALEAAGDCTLSNSSVSLTSAVFIVHTVLTVDAAGTIQALTSTITLATVRFAGGSIGLGDVSSTMVVGDSSTGVLTASTMSGTSVTGPGLFHSRGGALTMVSMSMTAPMVLGAVALSTSKRRHLLEPSGRPRTAPPTLSPLASICGGFTGSAITVSSGAGLSADLSCSTGATPVWSATVNGVSASIGALTVQSGGYLILTGVSGGANTLDVQGPLVVDPGSMVDITCSQSDNSNLDGVYIMRWVSSSCSQPTVTVDCAGASVYTVTDSTDGACYLAISGDSASNLGLWFLLLLILPLLVVLSIMGVWFMRRSRHHRMQGAAVSWYEMGSDTHYPQGPFPSTPSANPHTLYPILKPTMHE